MPLLPNSPYQTLFGNGYSAYPGSSGYWGNSISSGPQGGIRPGLGYPGDSSRIVTGQTPLDASLRGPAVQYQNALRTQTNPQNPTNINFHINGQPQNVQPSTVNSVKSPMFQTGINNLVNGVNNTSFNPNQNPNVLFSNNKNPAIQSAINGMFANSGSFSNPRDFTKSGQFQGNINQGYDQANQDKQNNRAQFQNFQTLFDSQTPQATANVNQENSAIGQWYNGGVANDLANNAANWTRNSRVLTNSAIDRVLKDNHLLSMVAGSGSYGNQQAMDTSGRLAQQQALGESELQRNNLLTVLQGQGQYGGVRDRNLDYLSNRSLTPINVRNQLGATEDARLAGLGQMDLSNNIYTTPAEQAQQRAAMIAQLSNINNNNNVYTLDSPQNRLAQQIGMFGNLQSLNNSNNFYGLQQPYQPNTSGYFPPANPNYNPQRNNFSNNYAPPANNFGPYASYSNVTSPTQSIPQLLDAYSTQHASEAYAAPNSDTDFRNRLNVWNIQHGGSALG